MVTVIPLFKLKNTSFYYFKAIIETLANLLSEEHIYCLITTGDLLIFAKNNFEISIKVSLPKEFFFDYLTSINYAFALEISHLAKIFERPVLKDTVVELAYLKELSRVTIIFLDHSTDQDSSIFEIPLFNYDRSYERIDGYDNEQLHKTHIILKPGKKTIYSLFGDQKYVDFEKDIHFELYTNPAKEMLRITTITTSIEHPKAKTTIKGPLALTVLQSLTGEESKAVYDYIIIRSLNKLDPLTYQLKLFYHTNDKLHIKMQFLELENCFLSLFMQCNI